jgi:hypothetical protein
MSGMPSQHSTLTVAQESLKMGKEMGDRTLKIVGLTMMIGTAVATMLHAAHAIYRDLFRKPKERDHDYEQRPSHSPPARPEHDEDSRPERKWTNRSELADRTPHGDHAQAAHRHRHDHGSQVSREEGHPVADGQKTTVGCHPFNDRCFGRPLGRLVLLVEGRFGLDFPDFETTLRP